MVVLIGQKCNRLYSGPLRPFSSYKKKNLIDWARIICRHGKAVSVLIKCIALYIVLKYEFIYDQYFFQDLPGPIKCLETHFLQNNYFFPGILPEALRTKCIRCTERQKRAAVKVIRRLKYEYPDEWSKLASRWDPTGDFTRYFEEFLAKEHFNTIPGSGNIRTFISRIPVDSIQIAIDVMKMFHCILVRS